MGMSVFHNTLHVSACCVVLNAVPVRPCPFVGPAHQAINLAVVARLDIGAQVLHIVLADDVQLVVGPVVLGHLHGQEAL